jgi:hypothetical protein
MPSNWFEVFAIGMCSILFNFGSVPDSLVVSLLESKKSVVLYVARNNPAAAKVYHRVGFQGLEPNQENVKDVEDWLELGFDRSRVQLGHW